MKKKILIIDDEKIVLRQVGSILSNSGYSYAFVPQPQLSFERLASDNFDLILLDVNMPGLNGITLLQKIKTDSNFQKIPVIIMTIDSDKDTMAACRENGANDIILKPINEEELISKVSNTINATNS